MRKYILAALLLGFTLVVNAQSGTNSPYSQYGLGVLSDQTSGFNRGMNGVGLGFHEHNQVNYLNPASYASIDSLSFIFDAGVSGQITNFEENGKKKNAKNANLEYVVAGFRLVKGLGLSFGIVPFTNVGYDYSTSGWVNEDSKEVSFSNTYHGEGGLHQAYLGLGFSPVRGLALGANVSYLWGDYTKTVTNSYSDSYVKTLSRTYTSQINNYRLDFGVQYTFRFSKYDWFTLGATYSPGHNVGRSDMIMTTTEAQTGVSNADTTSLAKSIRIPHSFGVGLMWNHNAQWKVGFDYTMQKWGSLDYPAYVNGAYAMQKDFYKDRSKFNLGMQYCYGERNRNFFRRIQYRAGASYATPYYKINGVDGPKEISVSAGFGIPIVNSYNNRSFLNISGQWVQSSAKSLIRENSFRINIGFTFNQNWFEKWKMD